MNHTFKKAAAAALCAAFALPCLAACGDTPAQKTLDGTYSLVSALLDGKNVTKDFKIYTATFSEEGTVRVVVNYMGALSTRNSTYSFDGTAVKENYGGEVYDYTLSGDQLTTVYRDYEDEIQITLEKEADQNEVLPVDFESILFGSDMSDSKYYNYCPAILRETTDEGEVMHFWYCTNRDDGVMMDYIGYRKGVKQENGKWLFGDEKIVLSPTEGTWDARHTCDPAVVKGSFKFQNRQYSYLMAYLGCVTDDYQKNETGIAVANSPEGPWVKVNTINPIVPWYDDGDYETEEQKYQDMKGTSSIYWGTGMPALVSIDRSGEVLMFYQSTLRGTGIRRYDFSDLDNPELKEDFTVSISSRGIVNSVGQTCRIGIPDFAYDSESKRFYVCGVTNEKNPPDQTLTRVNSHSMVAYLENIENMSQLCTLLQSGDYTWKMAGYVGPNDTGFERNHNPGIVRDAYGYLPDTSEIRVVVSTGHNSWDNENIFTYRLHGAVIPAPRRSE